MEERKQTTITEEIELSGVGIHSGAASKLRIKPAGPNHGIVFEIHDMLIPADIQNVTNTSRCTTLGKDGMEVKTVEHLLSACYGLGIDNLLVEVLSGNELPILDGSSLEFTKALKNAGVIEMEENRQSIVIEQLHTCRVDQQFISVVPGSELSITLIADYEHPVIGYQMVQYTRFVDDYGETLAGARTFAFKDEIEELRKRNLALGGTLDNALVISDEGYVNPVRFENEVARHKLLDFLGDLSLMGADILGHIFAHKTSHKINTEFVSYIKNLPAINPA